MKLIAKKIAESGLAGGSRISMQRNGTLLPHDTGTGRGAAGMFSKGLMSDCMTGRTGYGSGSDITGEAPWCLQGYGTGGSRHYDQLMWNLQDAHPRIYGYGGDHVLSLGEWA